MSCREEDDLRDAIEANAASLLEINESLHSSPADDELLEARRDLQAARTELAAALKGRRSAHVGAEAGCHPHPECSAHSTADAHHKQQGLADTSGADPSIEPAERAGPQLQARAPKRPTSVEPDFMALAKKYPDLARYVRPNRQGRGAIDFTDFEAARQLSRALLADDYGVSWWVPDGHLIPPVTNRANYIHWLHDLLSLCPEAGSVRVLDVGCGANLIYPLLGAAMHGWRFVGVDITDTAIEWAERNAAANPHLQHLLEIRRVPHLPGSDAGVLAPAFQEGDTFTFTMCNPPFFTSMEEAGQNPATAFSGTAAEMVCPGGELAFVTRMVSDSLALQDRVAWFTTMVGKKDTLKKVRALLHARGVPSVRSTQFTQGRTQRWGLAWSFTAAQPQKRRQPDQAAPAVARTKLSFSLKYSRGDPRRLLSLLASTMEAHGGKVAQQRQDFSLSAHFQQQGPAVNGSSNTTEQLGKGDTAHAAVANSGEEVFDVGGLDDASAAGHSTSAHGVEQRLAKKQRRVRDKGSEHRHGAFDISMTLRQESAGVFAVLASLQQDRTTESQAATAFSCVCRAIQQDVEQLLQSM